MSRRADHRASARLAGLQQLAATLRREELGHARHETDRRVEAECGALERNRLAEMALDEVVAQERLCLDRLTLAGLGLEASEAHLTASRVALAQARDAETSAFASYGEAEQRLAWISTHARDLRRKHLEKREEHAMSEASILRGIAGSTR